MSDIREIGAKVRILDPDLKSKTDAEFAQVYIPAPWGEDGSKITRYFQNIDGQVYVGKARSFKDGRPQENLSHEPDELYEVIK